MRKGEIEMKKIMILIALCLVLTACGTKEENEETGAESTDKQIEGQAPEQLEMPKRLDLEANITITNLEDASLLLHSFIEKELAADDFGGIYLDQENDKPFVIQVTKEADVDEIAKQLEKF